MPEPFKLNKVNVAPPTPINKIVNTPIVATLPEDATLSVLNSGASKEAYFFDEQAVKAHMSKIEELVNKQCGKKNHNPFLWLHENVNPLIDRFMGYVEKRKSKTETDDNGKPLIVEVRHKPERTKELFDKIMAIPLHIPPVELSVDENPTQYNIYQDKPRGLNLPTKG